MEKRIFLAVVISIALLALWSAVLPKFFPELAKKPEPPKPAATATATTGETASVSPSTETAGGLKPAAPQLTVPPPVAAPVAATNVQTTTVDQRDYTAVFSNRGAQLVSFKLKNYKRKDDPDQVVDLVRSREANRTDYPFAVETRNKPLSDQLNSALYAVTDRTERDGARVLDYRYSDGRYTISKTFRFHAGNP